MTNLVWVAEYNRVCLSRGRFSIIALTVSLKPMSIVYSVCLVKHYKTTENTIKRIFGIYTRCQQMFYVIYTERESVVYHGVKTPRSGLKNEAVGRVF